MTNISTGIQININAEVLALINKVDAGFADLSETVINLQKNVENTSTTLMSISGNQVMELADKFSQALSFSPEIKLLQADIQRFTNLTGEALENTTKKVYTLGEVFNENGDDIVRAANTMTQQMGGSLEDNLALIQEGFEKGANLNKDMLQQITEYAPHLKQAGISGAEGLAIMAQASKQGVYDDKAIDAIKEAGLSLREMGQTQIDALAGIGINANDLVGKSTIEAVQMISKAMKTADTQAKQMALTDIFKGAGEDAGLAFIEGLDTMEMDLSKLEAVKQPGEDLKTFFAETKVMAADFFGGILPYVDTFAQLGAGISTVIPFLKSFNIVQTATNFIMNLNPVFIIVTGIAALVAIIVVVIKKYDEWGAAMSLLLGIFMPGLGLMINLIQSFRRHWDDIKQAFTDGGFLAGIKMIGLTILDAILMPVQQLLEILSHIPGLGQLAQFGADKIEELRGNLDLLPEEIEVTQKVKAEETEARTDLITGYSIKDKKDQDNAQKKNQNTSKTSGGGFASAEKKSINVNIENLVKQFSINTQNITESKTKAKRLITEALVSAVRDAEVAIG